MILKFTFLIKSKKSFKLPKNCLKELFFLFLSMFEYNLQKLKLSILDTLTSASDYES